MADLPPSRRERIASRLSDLAREVLTAVTPERRQELSAELNRLAVGG